MENSLKGIKEQEENRHDQSTKQDIAGAHSLSTRQILATNLRCLMRSQPSIDTQQKLADQSGVGQPTIGRILREESDAGISTVESLAKPFRLEARNLLDSELFDQLNRTGAYGKSITDLPTFVPLIQWELAAEIERGCDSLILHKAEAWFNSPYAHSARAFCLEVKGLRMWPEYRDGEIILVDPEIEACHNDDIVISNSAQSPKTTFKRLQITEDEVYLTSLNKDFPRHTTEMTATSRICGVVIGSWMRRHLHR